MRTRTLIALTVLGSLVASAAIVAGVRLIQRLTGSDYVTTQVNVDLPGARAHPVATVLGLHASTLARGRANVSARKDATGLLAILGSDGSVVGEAIVPKDPLLKNAPVVVSYESTAVSLVQETPALITSSPLLSALIISEAHHSPAVGRLAGTLMSEAAVRRDYLMHPDAQLISSLNAAEGDVTRRVQRVLGGSPSASLGTAARTTDVVQHVDPGPGSDPPGQVRSVLLPDQIVLPDTSGQTACSTHSVTAALCLDNTYPLSLSNPELNATNWSGGWQMLYLSRQLSPSTAGTPLPFALLPPVVNAPPTLVSLISTIVESGIREKPQVVALCQAVQSELVQNSLCNLPSGPAQLADALLSQLTLAGSSQAVHVALTQQLEQQPISAVGTGTSPGPGASTTELDSWKASEVMSLATQLVVPAIQLVLDARSLDDEFTAHAAEEAHTAAREQAEHIREQITRDEQKLTQLANERNTARVNVDRLETKVAADQANVNAARTRLSAEEVKLQNAAPSSRGGLTRAVNLYRSQLQDAQARLDQAHSELSVARAIEDTNPQRTAELEDQLAKLRERENALERQAEVAQENKGVATADDLVATVFAEALVVANKDGRELGCAYHALLAGNGGSAAYCLGPVEAQLQQDAGFLVPLAVQSGLQFGVGVGVSAALYELCLPCHVIDFFSNALGFVQDAVDLGETLTIPDRHDFPAIDTNYRRGSMQDQLAVLGLGAFPAQAWAGGVVGVASNAVLSQVTGGPGPFVTDATTVCPDTVIVPEAYVTGRVVGLANFSNIANLHVAAGIGGVKSTRSLDGAVSFAVVQSLTPLGAGGASFADPPAKGAPVHVVDEGASLDYRNFAGTVSERIPGNGNPLVEKIIPARGTRLAASRAVGGFVFSASGRDRGQLVGLAEDENGGQLVVLTGPGVANVTSSVPACLNPIDQTTNGYF